VVEIEEYLANLAADLNVATSLLGLVEQAIFDETTYRLHLALAASQGQKLVRNTLDLNLNFTFLRLDRDRDHKVPSCLIKILVALVDRQQFFVVFGISKFFLQVIGLIGTINKSNFEE